MISVLLIIVIVVVALEFMLLRSQD
jgi:hypothetical protein